MAAKGKKCLEEFIKEELLESTSKSVWDQIPCLRIKIFTNHMLKTKLKVGETVIKLRDEQQLLGRFLLILEYRPGIVPKLDYTIGNYEMSLIVCSLCSNDGTLFIPSYKSTLMNSMADMNSPLEYELPLIISP